MSYQVLARQFRPKDFSELVGQEHVAQALINGLEHNRLHHAFLFTGTRGVGKTTIARILAKALNCEKGVTGSPCGVCTACREINEGKFVDLIEVDAASRTGVDDTRELLENVQYAPTYGRYKIYLIDEVHMFSRSSFNALLKTLEEPPEHVKFLLATTEPEKLPVTVLSRCLQFNLKRLNLSQISNHLAKLLDLQNISYEKPALEQIARAADGSMRDGLSLLDQALAFGAGQITDKDVQLMLGTIHQNSVVELLECVIDDDQNMVSDKLKQLHEFSPDYSRFLHDMASLLHELSLVQILNSYVENSRFDKNILQTLLSKSNPEQIQLFYEIASKGQDLIRLAPDSKTGFEMTIIRMFAFKIVSPDSGTAKKKRAIESNSTNPTKVETGSSTIPSNQSEVHSEDNQISENLGKYTLTDFNNDNWAEILSNLPIKGMTRELARNAKISSHNNTLILMIEEVAHNLMSNKAVNDLKDAITAISVDGIGVKIQQSTESFDTIAKVKIKKEEKNVQNVISEVENNPFVKHMQENFDAEVIQIKQGKNFLEV